MSTLKTYTLTNDNGMSVEIINLGARIKSILFPVSGKLTEMTVGYTVAESYLQDDFYLGATCGRVCNRISNAKFELDGDGFQLSQNDGLNCLHGGADNFSTRFWQEDTELTESNQLTLALTSEDGDQGFPGEVKIKVTYHLSSDNRLTMNFQANTNKATPINLTNHCYFNLGEASSLPLALTVNSSSYLERTDTGVPTGKILSSDNTDYSFQTESNIGERQGNAKSQKLVDMKGYDHCLILDTENTQQASAILTSYSNKVKMSLYTDQEAIQLYTGAFLSGKFSPYQGLCLEAQNYSDAINFLHFPNCVLRPDSTYNKTIAYQFESI